VCMYSMCNVCSVYTTALMPLSLLGLESHPADGLLQTLQRGWRGEDRGEGGRRVKCWSNSNR
jgi:hypothetical protein